MKLLKYEKQIIISLSVLFFLLLLFFLIRGFMLRQAVSKVNYKLNTSTGLSVNYGSAAFKGLKTIVFVNLLIKDTIGDTVLFSKNIQCNIKFFPLFTGKIRIKELNIRNLKTKIDSKLIEKYNHIKFVDTTSLNTVKKSSFENLTNQSLTSFFALLPDFLAIDTFSFIYNRDNNKLSIYTPVAILRKGYFNTTLYFSDIKDDACLLTGNFNKSSKEINLFASNPFKKPVTIPYLDKRYGLSLKFDSLYFNLFNVSETLNNLSLYTRFELKNLNVEHRRISPGAVITNRLHSDLKINIKDRSFEIDSSSSMTINNFTFSPYAKYSSNDEREILLKIPSFTFNANDMFSSFPKGLFKSISEMRVKGELTYNLNCYINLDNPDSVQISSDLTPKGFNILEYGLANLRMINDNFIYTAYEKNELAYSLEICPDNPDFLPFPEIPSILVYSVLTSEDGGFFHHRGFSEESIKKAISDNIKERRFVRGGSTITMQLVKNVYLNKNKTISRKLEEMLIVWMIENMRLVSKERMLEIYLNIIEWGPKIYGIKQASWYYFKKQPKELNLQECIFLASIIPSPKNFKYAFKAPDKLNDYYSWFYKRLPEVMIRREQLSPSDTIGLRPEVTLRGEAKKYIRTDSVLNARFFQYSDDDE